MKIIEAGLCQTGGRIPGNVPRTGYLIKSVGNSCMLKKQIGTELVRYRSANKNRAPEVVDFLSV